ncbi:MAG: hypothetical protein M3N50_12940 [Pseudomonadota bacterium]|nr:hypothetical protein [Pseudomonadota bacterium]
MNHMRNALALMAVCFAWGAKAQTSPAPAPLVPPAQAAAQAPPAQPPPPGHKPTAQSEAGEPRADTSLGPLPSAPAAPAVRNATPARAPTVSKTASPVASAAARPVGSDRLELGTATVTGSQEQPKVMYVVPWKSADIGDLAGKPMNSLVDEILAPVDRDVFKREVVYYQAMQAAGSQNAAPAHPAQQGEK